MIRNDSEILNCPSAHLFAYMNLCKTSLNLLEKCCCQSFLCALEPACCWRCACCCQSGVCSLERACWCRAVGVPLQGAGAGCCLLSQCCVQFGVGMLVPLQSAAAGAAWGCCCQSGVFVCVRSSKRMLWSGHAGEIGCRWTVLSRLWGCCRALACWAWWCKGLCLRALQGCLCRVLLH